MLGTEVQASLLSTVADPYRLAVLNALATGTKCVCDLQVRVPIAANLLSYHLKVLREAGLIVGVRRGRWIDYSLTPGALDRLHAAVRIFQPSVYDWASPSRRRYPPRQLANFPCRDPRYALHHLRPEVLHVAAQIVKPNRPVLGETLVV